MPALTASLFTRFRSRQDNPFAERLLAALRQQFGGHAVKKAAPESGATREPGHGTQRRSAAGLHRHLWRRRRLAHRKLLPALYNLFLDGALPEGTAVIGVGRKDLSDEQYREFAKSGVKDFSRRPIDESVWKRFAGSLFQQRGDRPGTRARVARCTPRHHRARARPAGEPPLLPRGAAAALRPDGAATGARAVHRAIRLCQVSPPNAACSTSIAFLSDGRRGSWSILKHEFEDEEAGRSRTRARMEKYE